MLLRALKTLAYFAIVVVSAAWLFNLIAAPKYLYSISSSVPSDNQSLLLSIGQLNPYPMSRECYRYIFIHPSSVELDTREIQWDYLVAQFTCDGNVSATWLSSTNVLVTTTKIPNGSLPYGSVAKSHDKSGAVQVGYRAGA
jgi:hypothetical protein